MSEERFKSDLMLVLISTLQRKAPVELERILSRFGFRDGDVTFHTTKTGKYWTTVNRWPWEPRPMTLAEVKDALKTGAAVRQIAERTLKRSPRR